MPRDSPSLLQLIQQLVPLSLSDVAMAAADPLIAMTLTRLPESTSALAALGVSKSLAVFFESPIIMVLHASTALGRDPEARKNLKHFVILLSLGLTAGFLLLSWRPVFAFWSTRIFHLTEPVAEAVQFPLLAMALWPALIAWRRFHQGLLILQGRGAIMGSASLVRIGTLAALLYMLPFRDHGAWIGAVAMMGGLLIETVLCVLAAHRSDIDIDQPDPSLPTTLPQVGRYFAPLASTMIVMWGGRAALLGILSHTEQGALTLAAWAASWGFVLMIANLSRMVQQLVIKYHNQVPVLRLLHLANLSGAFTTLVLASLGYTAAGQAILGKLIGSDPLLLEASLVIVKASLVVPILTAWQNLLQGFLIFGHQNRVLNWAALCGLIATLGYSSMAVHFNLPGPRTGAVALTLGLVVEVSFLVTAYWRLAFSSPNPTQKRLAV